MPGKIVYAVHLHQKQRNARETDDLISAESYYEAFHIFLDMASEYGISNQELWNLYIDDPNVLPQIDLGPSVINFLRSDEWEISDLETTDDEYLDGELNFVLHNRSAKEVKQRHVRLIQYRYDPSSWPDD